MSVNTEPTTRPLGRIGAFAPGDYVCKCSVCGGQFCGDKRAGHCLNCAIDDLLADRVTPGLATCAAGEPYADHSEAEAAVMAAYGVLRACGLIGAGDQRVPEQIGRTTQAMIAGRRRRAAA